MNKILTVICVLLLIGCNKDKINVSKQYLQNNNFDEAITTLTNINKETNQYAEAQLLLNIAYFGKAESLLSVKNYSEALIVLNKIVLTDNIQQKYKNYENYCKGMQAFNNNKIKESLSYLSIIDSSFKYYSEVQTILKDIDKNISSNIFSKVINIAEEFQISYDINNFVFDISKMQILLGDLMELINLTDNKILDNNISQIRNSMSKILKLYSGKNRAEYQGIAGGTVLVNELFAAKNNIVKSQKALLIKLSKLQLKDSNDDYKLIELKYNIELILNSVDKKISGRLNSLETLRKKNSNIIYSKSNEKLENYRLLTKEYLDKNIMYYMLMSRNTVVNGRGEELFSSTPEITKMEETINKLDKDIEKEQSKLLINE